MTNPRNIRAWLLERTGNHATDIREANEFADEFERLQKDLRRANAALVRHGVESIAVDSGEPGFNPKPGPQQAMWKSPMPDPVYPGGALMRSADPLIGPAHEPSPPHTTEDDFLHFLSYSGKRGVPHEADLQLAYHAGADAPIPVKSSVEVANAPAAVCVVPWDCACGKPDCPYCSLRT